MNLLILLCLTQVVWPVRGIYHMDSMETFLPPKSLPNNSFFGYSITYDPMNRQLVISAPAENNIGEVYECNIEHKNCTHIQNHISRLSPAYSHDYWFGATVKSGPDFVVMCAPRFTKQDFRYKNIGTYAQCFSYSKGRLSLLRDIDDNQRHSETKIFEHTMDSFGWSIDVASDDSVMIGGPGMFHGRAMLYKQLTTTPGFILNSDMTPEFNFGYSIASGTFINSKLSFAVSSPYGKYGNGQVNFYKGTSKLNILKKTKDDEVVGSMFGAVLCAARMYGDRTDLLVGAPTYATKSSYNVGAVYIYIAYKMSSTPIYKRIVTGQKDGSMFGSAIVNVGDLNGDRKDEVAIGAPFEDGTRGVVYLYSGADLAGDKTDKTLTWLQKIESEPAYGHAFGLSLTPLLDYDENGCNELAIGAPYSDAVVLLRCMAAITVKTYAVFPDMQNRTQSGKTNFTFQACLSVKYPTKPKNIIAKISTTVLMSHSDAKLSNGTYTYETSLHEKKTFYCKNVDFILPLDGKYDLKIGYQITSKLLDSPIARKKFEGSRVILSDRSVLHVQDSISAAECSGHTECLPNLALQIFTSMADEYTIGSSDKETFKITLINTGEVAYDSMVRVQILGARVFQTAPECVREPPDSNFLECAPTKPLRPPNGTWDSGNNILEMTGITNLDNNITITTQLFNNSKDLQSKNSSRVILLKPNHNDIFIKGVTNIGEIVNMSWPDVQDDGKQMEHVYTITNKGITNWIGLKAHIRLQKIPFITYKDIPVSVYGASNLPRNCEQAKNDTDFMEFSCPLDSLPKQAPMKIFIPMFVLPGTLSNIIKEKNVSVESTMTLLENKVPLKDSVTIHTSLQLNDVSVPLWVILLAALIGLFIVIIIGFILYELGFLRRKNREHLKELQRSVKRQTIRRSTMMSQPSREPDDNDRRQILERMNEESEDEAENANEGRKKKAPKKPPKPAPASGHS